MYETMEVYPSSWMFYLFFIFLTAFAFLNMVMGRVLNVLDEEHQQALAEDEDHVDINDVMLELHELKATLARVESLLPNTRSQ